MTKRWRRCLIAPLSLGLILMSGGAEAETRFLTLGSGPSGGTYHAIIAGLAKIYNAHLNGIEARVETTSGAFENVVLVSSGQVDAAPTNANLAVWALEGTEVYRGKQQPNIALLMGGLAGGSLHIGVLDDSPVRSIGDLRGKKVAVGPQGNTTALQMALLLKGFGIGSGDYSPVYVNYNDGISALADGTVDAAIINTAPPVAAFKELGFRKKFRFLPVPEDKRREFLAKYPFYSAEAISGRVYGLPEDTSTIGSINVIVVRKDLDADLVYQMLKATYDNLPELQAAHPSAKAINPANGPGGGLPLHPGAERFFKQRGVLK